MESNPTNTGLVDRDAPCVSCGYNLRTLATDGKCPECGTSVAVSLRPDQLAFADARWIFRMRLGAGISAIACFSIFVSAWLGSQPESYEFTVGDGAIILLMVGGWIMGWPEPMAARSRPNRTRSLMRVAYVGAGVAMLLLAFLNFFGDWLYLYWFVSRFRFEVVYEVLRMMVILFVARGLLSQSVYVGRLARRMPADWLARFSIVVASTMPLLVATYAAADLAYWNGEMGIWIDTYFPTWWDNWRVPVLVMWVGWPICGFMFICVGIALSRRSIIAPRRV